MDLFSLPKKLNEVYMSRHEKYHKEFDQVKELILAELAELGLNEKENSGKRFHKFVSRPWVDSYGFFVTKKYLNKLGLSSKDFYKINSEGFRCDEFTADHSGKHILFAGCSLTFGDSVPEEFLWAHKLYTSISHSTKTSGYFNLGKPSASMSDIINLIDEYIIRYGKPDYLFILFPEPERDMWNGVEAAIRFIENNNINAFAMTWDRSFSVARASKDDDRNKIKYLYQIDEDRFLDHLYRFGLVYNGKYKDIMLKAMDDSHPGIAEQDFYASKFYELLMESESWKDS